MGVIIDTVCCYPSRNEVCTGDGRFAAEHNIPADIELLNRCVKSLEL